MGCQEAPYTEASVPLGIYSREATVQEHGRRSNDEDIETLIIRQESRHVARQLESRYCVHNADGPLFFQSGFRYRVSREVRAFFVHYVRSRAFQLESEPCAACLGGFSHDPETPTQDMKARGGGGDGGAGLLGGLKLGGGKKGKKAAAAATEEARDPEQVRAEKGEKCLLACV